MASVGNGKLFFNLLKESQNVISVGQSIKLLGSELTSKSLELGDINKLNSILSLGPSHTAAIKYFMNANGYGQNREKSIERT